MAWVIVKGNKGHLPEDVHLELLNKVKPLIPAGADVIFLGDGEFDGNRFQATINNEEQWEYVCWSRIWNAHKKRAIGIVTASR
ncbi:MAG: hypothetical protein GY796_33365 [Chloroflexi bacterium]|nr:hypothetical protein [Chloroflexota bacterium]